MGTHLQGSLERTNMTICRYSAAHLLNRRKGKFDLSPLTTSQGYRCLSSKSIDKLSDNRKKRTDEKSAKSRRLSLDRLRCVTVVGSLTWAGLGPTVTVTVSRCQRYRGLNKLTTSSQLTIGMVNGSSRSVSTSSNTVSVYTTIVTSDS